MVGHLDDQRGRRSDIDVHLRAVAEVDHLRHDACDGVVPVPTGSSAPWTVMRSGRMTMAASPGLAAPSSTAAPRRVPSAEPPLSRCRPRARRRQRCWRRPESGDEGGRRGVDLLGRPTCSSSAKTAIWSLMVSFLLVVGDVHERDADLALHGAQLQLQLLAQLGVQRTERLVEQQHLRASTSARASATRCCCPPDSWAGRLREIAHPRQLECFADTRLGSSLDAFWYSARTRRCPTPS